MIKQKKGRSITNLILPARFLVLRIVHQLLHLLGLRRFIVRIVLNVAVVFSSFEILNRKPNIARLESLPMKVRDPLKSSLAFSLDAYLHFHTTGTAVVGQGPTSSAFR